ncbi:MAG: S9 family peptidase [Acidobacteria bacterium]|nr:S9 family peptidase [Acidobacteriota bacterium]
MPASRRRITPLALLVLCLPVPGAGQTQRPMTLVDLINVAQLANAQLSPDGRHVIYTLSTTDWKANERVTHIWRVDAAGANPVQLTNGPEGESAPRWSPDGKTIAFLAKRTGDDTAQIYLLSNTGGEAVRLTSHATAPSSVTWAIDGRAIWFLSEDAKSDEEKTRDKAKDDVFKFDESSKHRHLWKVTVVDQAEARVTGGDFSVSSYRLSRDGRMVAFHRSPGTRPDDSLKAEVWVMDADGKNQRELTRNTVSEGGAELSPDNTQVIFTTASADLRDEYYSRRLYSVALSGGAPRTLMPDFPYEVQQATWAKDGRSIFFTANMGVHSELFQLEVGAAKPRQLTDGEHSIGWDYSVGADTHVVTINDATRAGDAWLLPATGGTPAQVTRVFDYLARDFKMPRQQKVQWKGADGVTVEGVLYYPLDYEAGRRYPLCVQTHGGPQASDKFGFPASSDYIPVLAAKGYVVLKPNYRGSTGYGDPFLRDMVGHYFQNAHKDVMAGVDHVIGLGIADPDRMVAMGWSAGGHMTNKLITFTNRFKAASSGAGAANWVSMYSQSQTRTFRTPWFGGTPWQKNAPIDVYWEHSPLKYVANVTTPTIFLVGQEDPQVPAPQSVEMYRALKSNGIPTHLYMAPREGHGWAELRHALFKRNVELEWFEKHATGRSYVWEKAPEGDKKDTSKTTSQPQG